VAGFYEEVDVMTTIEESIGADPGRPNAACLYNLYTGGPFHRQADRDFAHDVIYPLAPFIADWARQNRAFCERAVRYFAEQGIRQFLDLGAGFPAATPIHEITGGRVVYVDADPDVVAAYERTLGESPTVTVVRADVRDPEGILAHPRTRRLLDFTEPVAVLMVAVVHFLGEDDHPHELIKDYRRAVAPGSFLALSHGTLNEVPASVTEGLQLLARYGQASSPLTPRPRADIAAFFDGCELVDPGLVFAADWRPEEPPAAGDPARPCNYAAVGKVA
jgi:SAM-dependent methyltransferase